MVRQSGRSLTLARSPEYKLWLGQSGRSTDSAEATEPRHHIDGVYNL